MAAAWRSVIILAAVAAAFAVGAARAETRLALVIGNSNYVNVNKLPNPDNDARAVADEVFETIKDLRFQGHEISAAAQLTPVRIERIILKRIQHSDAL